MPQLRPFAPLAIVVASLLLAGSAHAQSADDAIRFADRTPGVTAYSLGLGGVGISGVTDASAFVINPAGLGWLSSSSVSGSFGLGEVTTGGTFNAPGFDSFLERQVTEAGIANLSYLFKVPTTQGSMVIGAALSGVHSYTRTTEFDGDNGSNSITDYFIPFSDEFDLFEDADGIYPDFTRTLSFIAYETFAIDLDQGLLDAGDPVPFLPAVSAGTVAQYGFFEDSGQMMELNFGGAMEAAPDVMVGFSLNIPIGSFERTRIIQEEDFQNDNDGTSGTTDFDYLYFSERFTSDLVGVNGRFGVSMNANDNMRIGGTIETPTVYAIEESYGTYLETEFDNGDLFAYGDQPGQTAGSGEFDYTLTTPWRLGMGFSFETGPVMLMADVEWVDWSQMELSSNTYDFGPENLDIRDALQSVVNVRLGAVASFDNIEVRAGAGYHPDPRTEQRFHSEGFPSVDRGRTFGSLGLGYKLSDRIGIDLGWMMEELTDRSDLYVDVRDAPYVSEDVTRNRFQFGMTLGL